MDEIEPQQNQGLLSTLRNMPDYQRRRVALVFIAGVAVIVGITFLFGGFGGGDEEKSRGLVTLHMWNVFDPSDVWHPVIREFEEKNPNVRIVYTQKPAEDYRADLTEALADGAGPDIYAIHNTWLPIEINRLISFNDADSAATSVKMNELLLRFPEVVQTDFVRNGELYALPISIDTIALYYNIDLLNSESILEPPSTWDELAQDVRILRKFDPSGNIVLAGAALGAGANINRNSDIISALMMQYGARMNNAQGDGVMFSQSVSKEGIISFPGQDALSFYTSFANSSSANYTWDLSQDDSVNAFTQGRAAMMLNYSFARPIIARDNPELRFGVAPLPQKAGELVKINYANYWGLGVSEQSAVADIAWRFINFLAEEDNAKIYFEQTDKPPALKSLIDDFQRDEELAVFANQILTAKSWITGDASAAEKILTDMVDNAVRGAQTIPDAINRAANDINQILSEL